jgi:DNA-binding NtrC family response regulator
MSKTLSTKLLEQPDARLLVAQAEVRIVAGPDRGLKLALPTHSVVVGSSQSCDLVLHDRTVSARHAELQLTPRGYYVRDLGSTNGVVCGAQPTDRAPLVDGMRITLGDSVLVVRAIGKRVALPLARPGEFGGLCARSVKMRAFVAALVPLAESDVPVLIEGETGSGKELCAGVLHRASARRGGPFVAFDCAATTPALVADMLFGHEKGAFTGANQTRVGLLEEADGGTLFLDEIAELPLELQPLLLGALERKRSRRIGGRTDVVHDVRVVAATRRNLAEEVRQGRVRQDLYYRISVGRLRIPPLRERPEDIPILADQFAREAGLDLSPETLGLLLAYEWPGNVRELRNTVARLSVQPEGAMPDPPDRPRSTMMFDERGRLRPWLEARAIATASAEREYVAEVLAQFGGNLSHAAEAAGITRPSLTALALKHGLHPRGPRG